MRTIHGKIRTMRTTTSFHRTIDADHVSAGLRLAEVREYYYLIWLLAKRRLTVRYKQTILGPLWQVIHPLLASLAHMVVFGFVAKVGTDGIPMILFYLAGNTIWGFASGIVSECSNTFRGNASLFGKVYFPRLCVPFANILASAVDFLINLFVLTGFSIFYLLRGEVSIPFGRWIFLPLILLWLGLLASGIGILISSFTTKYRDMAILVGFGLQLWMYLTPVVYPVSSVPGRLLPLLIEWNPAAAPIEMFRMLLFGTPGVPLRYIVWSAAFTLLVFFAGALLFNRVERTFMDTV